MTRLAQGMAICYTQRVLPPLLSHFPGKEVIRCEPWNLSA